MHLLRRHALIPVEPLREMAEEADRRWARRGHLILLIYVVGLLLCYAGGFWYRSSGWGLVEILFALAQFAFMFGAFIGTWIWAKRARFGRIHLIMLKHRRCPHCGYNLRLLPTDPEDQTTVCPECGCAWLIDDAVLTERLVATTPVAPPGTQKKLLVLMGLLLGVMALGGLFLALKLR